MNILGPIAPRRARPDATTTNLEVDTVETLTPFDALIVTADFEKLFSPVPLDAPPQQPAATKWSDVDNGLTVQKRKRDGRKQPRAESLLDTTG